MTGNYHVRFGGELLTPKVPGEDRTLRVGRLTLPLGRNQGLRARVRRNRFSGSGCVPTSTGGDAPIT